MAQDFSGFNADRLPPALISKIAYMANMSEAIVLQIVRAGKSQKSQAVATATNVQRFIVQEQLQKYAVSNRQTMTVTQQANELKSLIAKKLDEWYK